MNKNCPRCQTTFECKQTDIANCQCSGIQLDSATRTYLQATYTDCLCINCLHFVNEHSDMLLNESNDDRRKGR